MLLQVRNYLLKAILFSCFFILTGCSGYNITGNFNPFEEYNIQSVTVPVFLNRSIISGLSGPITSEVKQVLQSDTSLTVYAGNNSSADAVLLGIIESNNNKSSVYSTTTRTFTDGTLKESIGARNEFYVPNATTYKVRVNLILIKRPSSKELKVLKTSLSPIMNLNPKVIFQKEFVLEGAFSRVIKSTLSSDDGGIVNFTTNRQVFRKSVDVLARNMAIRLQEEILYAF